MKRVPVPSVDLTPQILGFENKLYRIALRLTRNPDDARDLVQETFLKAFTAISTIKGPTPDKLEAWLIRILRNSFLDQIRKKDPIRKSADVIDTVSDKFSDVVLIDHTDFSQGLREEELLARAFEKIKDPEIKNIFRLRFIEDLSINEICEQTGFTRSKVKICLHRGYKHLREKWRFIDPALSANDDISPDIR